jgi:hypothetical protein
MRRRFARSSHVVLYGQSLARRLSHLLAFWAPCASTLRRPDDYLVAVNPLPDFVERQDVEELAVTASALTKRLFSPLGTRPRLSREVRSLDDVRPVGSHAFAS